jgi:ribose 5-phosphate isomerase RpiB
MPWPIPVFPPVTTATFPVRSKELAGMGSTDPENTEDDRRGHSAHSGLRPQVTGVISRCNEAAVFAFKSLRNAMKIALITENSQAAKNGIIHTALTAVAEPLGHEVFNYGMYSAEDKASLTYVMNGLLTGILLNSGAADFVVTGCGTGMGSMLACNAMPGVFCGLVIDPTDAFLFAQINDGNAISMPYAKGFGWAAELNLQDVYSKLFDGERGLGYPKERAEIMARNRGILKQLKSVTCNDMLTVLQSVDQDLLKSAIAGERFKDYFFANAKDQAIADYIRTVV